MESHADDGRQPMDEEESLGAVRNVSLVFRLAVDRFGRLREGEVIDAVGRPSGRFDSWSTMTKVVQRVLERDGGAAA